MFFGAAGTTAYVLVSRGGSWETLFMLCILALLTFKFFGELKTVPGIRLKPVDWLQSRGTLRARYVAAFVSRQRRIALVSSRTGKMVAAARITITQSSAPREKVWNGSWRKGA